MLKPDPQVVVIYDGECRFCLASLAWVRQKLVLTSHAFQEADLGTFGLNRSECEKSVFVVIGSSKFSGAAAIAALLTLRGNTFLGWMIKKSGKLGEFAYRQLASHRGSLPVRIVTRFLERAVS